MQAGLLDQGFIDSWALNLYHDGSGALSTRSEAVIVALPPIRAME